MKLATLCYVHHEGKTLMLYRNKKENDYHEGKWNGLGGKFEDGETPEECAVREVEEESGLTMLNPVMKGHITFPLFDGVDDWYVFVFSTDRFEGSLIDSPEGTLEWIPDDKLSELNLWEGDKHFIPWLFQDKFFSARFDYKNGGFVNYTVKFY
ncbi:MAG: 8-oxo-dGTP diphosphatase [Melioribacteraceae bacterium]|nr:8-oxo-dGTP diphosphatase [Melioribacteraceae bacterium]